VNENANNPDWNIGELKIVKTGENGELQYVDLTEQDKIDHQVLLSTSERTEITQDGRLKVTNIYSRPIDLQPNSQANESFRCPSSIYRNNNQQHPETAVLIQNSTNAQLSNSTTDSFTTDYYDKASIYRIQNAHDLGYFTLSCNNVLMPIQDELTQREPNVWKNYTTYSSLKVALNDKTKIVPKDIIFNFLYNYDVNKMAEMIKDKNKGLRM